MAKKQKKDLYLESLPGDTVKLPPHYWEDEFEKLVGAIGNPIAKVVRVRQKGNNIEVEFMKKGKDYPCKKCKKECKSLHSCVKVLNWLLGK